MAVAAIILAIYVQNPQLLLPLLNQNLPAPTRENRGNKNKHPINRESQNHKQQRDNRQRNNFRVFHRTNNKLATLNLPNLSDPRQKK